MPVDSLERVIPTVFRDDYIGALRRLDRANDPSVLIDALRFANDWSARIDFTNTSTVRAQLEATHAFAEEGSSERLLLPPSVILSQRAENS